MWCLTGGRRRDMGLVRWLGGCRREAGCGGDCWGGWWRLVGLRGGGGSGFAGGGVGRLELGGDELLRVEHLTSSAGYRDMVD